MARKLLLGALLLLALAPTVQGQSPSQPLQPTPPTGGASLMLPGQSRPAARPTLPAPPASLAAAPSGVSLSLPGQAVTPHPVTVQRPAAIESPAALPEEIVAQAVFQPSPQLLPPPPGAGSMQRQPGQPPEVRPIFPAPVPGNPSGIQPVQNIVSQNRTTDSDISLELPGSQRIFGRLDNEAAWQERVRQEARDKSTPDRNVTFPDEVTLTSAPYTGRNWPRQMTYVEPNYLIYRRLYFQELNSERYGWDLGPLSPVVSTLHFYKDTLLFPYNFGSDICRRFETNAGYCLPGDPVPYMLYPPGASLSGGATQTATLLILLAAFP